MQYVSDAPDVPVQRRRAAPAAQSCRPLCRRGSWARALYGDPDRCMRLLGDLREGPECERLKVSIILDDMEVLHSE